MGTLELAGAVGLGLGVGVEPIVGVRVADRPAEGDAGSVSVEPGDPIELAVGVPAASEGAGLTLGAGEPQAARPIAAAIARAIETDQPCRSEPCGRRNRINGNDSFAFG